MSSPSVGPIGPEKPEELKAGEELELETSIREQEKQVGATPDVGPTGPSNP